MQYQTSNTPSYRPQAVRAQPLKNSPAYSGFSVIDIEEAKEFYGDMLGLDVSEIDEMGCLTIRFNDDHHVMIYPKENHQPASFTIMNFPVHDIEQAVSDLKARGIQFESYEGEIRTDADNIHRSSGPLIAWFKDPAGNILSVIQEDR